MRNASIHLACLLFSAAGIAHACNVPVFRYALERWRPDRYDVVIFHRGLLGAENEAALAPIYKAEEQDVLKLRIVNLDKPVKEGREQLWDSQENPELPWMVVRYPAALHIDMPTWKGPFNADTAKIVAESPARQELAKRLMAGQTAVWILLESGDAAADGQAASIVEKQLKEMEKTLELPQLTAAPEDEVRSALPLAVKFSMLRVSRSDPQEKVLVQMLLGSEPDLRERTDTMLFPIFGRGRALFGLVGPGITADNMSDAGTFLVGPCTCQLKEFNPGFDVLNMADWDRIWGDDAAASLVAQAEDTAVSQPGVQVPIPSGPPILPAPPSPVGGNYALPDPPSSFSFSNTRILLIAGIAIVAVLAIVTLVASKRPSAPQHPGNE